MSRTENKDIRQARYEKRDYIENILKEKNIARDKFHETGKHDYEKIIKRIYYTFCDHEKYPQMNCPICGLGSEKS